MTVESVLWRVERSGGVFDHWHLRFSVARYEIADNTWLETRYLRSAMTQSKYTARLDIQLRKPYSSCCALSAAQRFSAFRRTAHHVQQSRRTGSNGEMRVRLTPDDGEGLEDKVHRDPVEDRADSPRFSEIEETKHDLAISSLFLLLRLWVCGMLPKCLSPSSSEQRACNYTMIASAPYLG